jgi:cytochrome c oxidase assembly protein subunit 15
MVLTAQNGVLDHHEWAEGQSVGVSSLSDVPKLKISQRGFLTISQCALGFLCVIVVSGALVRLTGSGLGCVDWPGCSETQFVDVSTGHTAIEQINRLFTGVVSAAVAASALGSFLVSPRRRSMILLAVGLVVGVLVQVLLGAVVVLTGLNPWSNMAHFLVSMVLITMAVLLVDQAKQSGEDKPESEDRLSSSSRQIVNLIMALCGLAIVFGTLVTGTGPHAGDENAVRLDYDLRTITRVHSVTVLICVGLTILLFLRIKKNAKEWHVLGRPLEVFLGAAVAQGALGYFQYVSGVPAQLVAVHIALAIAVWISVLRLGLASRR